MPDFSNLTIVQNPSPDIRRLAYERFVYDFVALESPNCPVDEPSDALWGFLPELYRKSGDNSCVVAIIDAVAYTNFAHRCNAPQAETLAEQSLGTGMTLLAKTIANEQHAASNEALAAVYFLGFYEVSLWRSLDRAASDGSLEHQHETEEELVCYSLTWCKRLVALQIRRGQPCRLRVCKGVRGDVCSDGKISRFSTPFSFSLIKSLY
jgi:hypothetical protein